MTVTVRGVSAFQKRNISINKILFTNRTYTLQNFSSELSSWEFLASEGGKEEDGVIIPFADGEIYIIAGNRDISGWERMNETEHYYDDTNKTQLFIYKKSVKAGQLIDIPKVGSFFPGISPLAKNIILEMEYPAPGVVISHNPSYTKVYLASPSICVLPNGDYLVAYEDAGTGTTEFPSGTTWIYSSSDKGAAWQRISSIPTRQTWSNIFQIDGVVYIMGVQGPIGSCIIRKSLDNGKTWTEPVDGNTGLLIAGEYHTAPVPMVIHNGRIWRAMEAKNPNNNTWPKMYNAMMMSAPVGSDLLKSSNWTKSNQLSYNSNYLNGNFGGWLEGNAVVDKNGKVKDILRVEVPDGVGEYAAIVDISDDGKTANFNPATGFVEMPGGAKKFTIRYDEISGRYWTLVNEVLPEFADLNPGIVRNVLSLCSSEDLNLWEIHERVLQHEDIYKHGFQYADWVFDGDDIIFVSRTSYDDAYGGASNHHDANYITFHRIENFRNGVNTSFPKIDESEIKTYLQNKTLYIESSQNKYDNVSLYNMMGVQYYSDSCDSGQIDVSSLNKGVYIINVSFNNGETQSSKFIL
jgi:hypothetical protein